MSTGISPGILGNLDDPMLRAITDEAKARRWGHVEELLAINTEILHALYRLTLAMNSKERTPLPEPFRYPRPSNKPDEPEVVEEEIVEQVTIHTYRRAMLGGGNPIGSVGR